MARILLVRPSGEMVDTRDLKSLDIRVVPVRVRPRADCLQRAALSAGEPPFSREQYRDSDCTGDIRHPI